MDSNYKVKNIRCRTPYKKYQFCFGGGKKEEAQKYMCVFECMEIFFIRVQRLYKEDEEREDSHCYRSFNSN